METAVEQAHQERLTRWLQRSPNELTPDEKAVTDDALARRVSARNVNSDVEKHSTFGQRLADRIAAVGGSWTFIVGFILFLIFWVAGNAVLLGRDEFDPYPFVFLNLVLSMIAALQAPVIMMSQNRQSERDRIDAQHDYQVNLKAEIEILALHEKLDALRGRELTLLRDEIAALRKEVLTDRETRA